jgi:hypothetical protein
MVGRLHTEKQLAHSTDTVRILGLYGSTVAPKPVVNK